MLTISANPILYPKPNAGKYDPSVYGKPITDLDLSIRAECVSRFADAREVHSAAQAIGKLPGEREAVHMLIGGKHSMGHIVPAILSLSAPATIDELTLATLTFSKRNASDLCEMIDAGVIRKLIIVVSKYFTKTSTAIYEPAAALLKSRGVRMLCCRSHAKLICAKLTNGRTIAAEGSANIRSCKTLEQLTIFGARAVYDFHRGWIQRLIDREENDARKA